MKNTIIKTNEFEVAVRNGYYDQAQTNDYSGRKEAKTNGTTYLNTDTFHKDFKEWIRGQVPDQYLDKVASYAWAEGHSHGYVNVLNVSYDLIEIFN